MRSTPRGPWIVAVLLVIGLAFFTTAGFHAQVPPPGDAPLKEEASKQPIKEELVNAAIRLPLAMLLGTVLALRPRRRGLPPRSLAVIETQVILAVVGAVVMLVVGASLARAFGIVGVAGLIRYRSKINDPKDAVVMLSALAVGLAAGSGLYALSVFSTLFLTAALGTIEAFEPRIRTFELVVKLADKTAELRPKIEEVLRRYGCTYEVRTVSESEVSYVVTAPWAIKTDRASKALTALEPGGKGAVEWKEIARKEPK